MLEGEEISNLRALAEKIDGLIIPETGKPLHTAIRYGITQALLDATAKTTGRLMVDVVSEEYQIQPVHERIPIFAQSGNDRYTNADKMIVKGGVDEGYMVVYNEMNRVLALKATRVTFRQNDGV